TERRAEPIIADTLTQRGPGAGGVGEELSPGAARAGEVVWIVDPLDGTTNYLHGYPHYAVSVGAMVRGALSVGVIHDVTRDLVYRAATGHGPWRGERQLAVSRVAEPPLALVRRGRRA